MNQCHCAPFSLQLSIVRPAREGNDVTNVLNASGKENHALKSQTKASMCHGAESARTVHVSQLGAQTSSQIVAVTEAYSMI